MDIFAHSRNAAGQRHLLSQHLHQVASLAALFAKPLGASELARLTGLLHDIGKFHPDWQAYLIAVEDHPALKGTGPDHKGAGAVFLLEQGWPDLALLIQGHHGGLTTPQQAKDWLQERTQDSRVGKSIALAKQCLSELQQIARPPIPPFVRTRLEGEFFLRMLFSALVDADSLDAEKHFTKRRASLRQTSWEMADLLAQFETYYQQFAHVSQTPVNQVRAQVYYHCVRMASQHPGFYRLTVPTGGGKTLASLAFSLFHAVTHGKKRLIYAIPFMSITEQTAHIFRQIFTGGGVLEHHSGLLFPENQEMLTRDELWQRLTAENWDAPVVVTTTVQLFESLLARKPSTCRKLHNIANSVIVLDEVQMLPTNVLDPILDVLRELVAHYGVTVVLCTATQPALHERDGFQGLPAIQEIIPDAQMHFTRLKRVEYQWRLGRLSWKEVAQELCQEHQVLAIVNTRAHAQALVEELTKTMVDPSSVFHLSTRMCGAHRRHVLQIIQQRLDDKKACHVISTQLIEAGVDIDFPCVWRAIGPMDRLAQAAGRANREGKLIDGDGNPLLGRVIIFEPEAEGLPPGAYRIGTKISRSHLQANVQELHHPAIFQAYFEELFEYVACDEKRIQQARRSWDYKEVAENFRLIEETMFPVVVLYADPEEPGRVERLLGEIQDELRDEQRQDPSRVAHLSRLLRPYVVNISETQLAKAMTQSLVQEVCPGIWQWHRDQYDPVRGLVFPDPTLQDQDTQP